MAASSGGSLPWLPSYELDWELPWEEEFQREEEEKQKQREEEKRKEVVEEEEEEEKIPGEEDDDETSIDIARRVPASLKKVICPIIRTAKAIEKDSRRVAYLCRFAAYQMADIIDPDSTKHDVPQFKARLLYKLERDEKKAQRRLGATDAQEIRRFWMQYRTKNEIDNKEKMERYQKITNVLYDVLKFLTPEKYDPEIDQYAKEKPSFSHYNILPLNTPEPVMEIPEIKAAVDLLRYTANLPKPRTDPTSASKKINDPDLFDWLQQTFGFQKGNVENQREHLILLLANIDMRQRGERPQSETHHHTIHNDTVTFLTKKLFQNYTSWCRYLNLKSNNKIPRGASTQQPELLYIGLFFLIWGEASNVRFMPECLCYIFHQMAKYLYDIISTKREDSFDPPFGSEGSEDAFLHAVIQPIFTVMQEEAAMRNKHGTGHSKWRNYDDLNEYFWSKKCFKQLKWPMDLTADFFSVPTKSKNETEKLDRLATRKRIPKTNFVEHRTFLHLFRSFDRMWTFFILAFQAMVIIAWSPSGSISSFFERTVFRNLMTIFITDAFLKFLHATLEIVLTWKAWRSLERMQQIRYILKFSMALGWMIILPTTYINCVQNCTGLVRLFNYWLGSLQSESIYNYAVVLYMLPNLFSALFFIFLPFRRALEYSNSRIVRSFLWWSQPKLYIAQGMYDDTSSFLKYMLFWIVLLICKLAFSYYVEISPLVGLTREVMLLEWGTYEHFSFPYLQQKFGVLITLWAPVVMVYFMDTQVWYSIVSTICGGMIGVIFRLGEVHDLSTFRSRFKAIPRAFSKNLVPRHGSQSNMSEHEVGKNKKHNDEFSDTWNAFIISLREEDLISNRERVLLIVPSSMATAETTVFQWPAFLLAGKIRCAVAMASSSKPSDQEEFMKKIKQDKYTYDAIMECYDTLLNILYDLLVEPNDKKVLDRIRADIENSIRRNSFLKEFRLDELPTLIAMFGKLLDLVKDYGYGVRMKTLVVKQLQDILEGMTRDFMMHGEGILDNGKQLFESINLDSIKGSVWREKCVRLQLLLTIRESTIDVPSNLEARCRILFFANSLFMKMPIAPRVQSMMSFSVLTPYFKEKVLFSEEDLLWKKDEYGLSMLGYLRKIYPDEFQNFLERTNFYPRDEEEIKEKIDEICLWASYRRQTLTRTVRGMMYYRRALEIQCIQDKADLDKFDSDKMIESAREARATADIKFTYIISCQLYGMQEKSMDAEDTIFDPNILNLMTVYPSLRVAYIDEVEVQNANGMKEKTYFSVLVKGRGHKQYEMKGAGHKQYEEIYRIKLPGKPTHIGEGKPEMQNHALIFTRGEALQAIDMNQDNYLEEAFKLRNLLEEFESEKYGKRKPTILGLREHIFTGSVSSLALFMSHQETSFATIGQRVLANPLKVRFHYGHSDIFDRLFHITRGGISKASKTLNISGGTFSGFNSIMRGGIITHHDYVQVGKGLDVGMNQVSCFEANMANGSGEQTLSRDIYRLGHRFDFYRMLSLYFTTVGFYFSSMVSVLAVYVFLYGRLYLVIRGLDKSVLFHQPTQENVEPLESSLASQSVFQLGFLLVLPILMEFALEIGFPRALRMFIFMQLQLASVFFAFQHGTRTHYYGRTIFYGPATCRPTTHGSAVYHATFAENYRMYSRSHFCKGLELLMLLVVIQLYGSSYHGSSLYRFLTFSIWFMVASWLFAPFIFNPSCFDWQSITEDWIDWRMWIGNKEVLSMSVDQSWETWWKSEQEHLRKTSNHALLEVILSFRFLIYHCGILYYLEIAQPSQSRLIFSLTCLGVLSIVVFLKVDDIWQHRFRTDLQLMFRILKALIFLGSVLMISVLFIVANLNVSDVLVSLLGFILTGWCILLIGQACSPILKKTMLWDSIVELARAYDSMMGFIIFFPIIVLAWFPWVPGLQKRLILTKRSAGPPRSQESTVFGQTLAWEDANQEDVTNEMEELDDQDQSENLVAENNSRKKALIPNLRKTMKHTWSTKIIPRRF